jgi:hypothetical protein
MGKGNLMAMETLYKALLHSMAMIIMMMNADTVLI